MGRISGEDPDYGGSGSDDECNDDASPVSEASGDTLEPEPAQCQSEPSRATSHEHGEVASKEGAKAMCHVAREKNDEPHRTRTSGTTRNPGLDAVLVAPKLARPLPLCYRCQGPVDPLNCRVSGRRAGCW